MPDPGMRILQVMRAPVGGLFRHVADLTRALSDRGHEVGLVVDSLANDSQTEAKLAALAPYAKLGIHRMAMPRLFGAGDLTAPLSIRRLSRKLDINVIHGHGAKGGFYARLARIGSRDRVALYTPHGGVLHYSPTSMSGRLFHRLERSLMGQTAAIIFESAYARKTYAALIGDPTCHTAIIHNGLAAEEFIPVPPDADAADFVFVGELRDLKGIHVLVDALAGVTRPDGTLATLVMAGEGSSRGELEAQIERLGLTSRVKLLGSQPARPTFALGRVAIVPSLAESLPYIVIEAAAAHLPVIATDVGGISEIFGPTAASLVPASDAAALRAAMQSVLDVPDGAMAEMRARLTYIENSFSLERMTRDIEDQYRAALGRS